MLPSKSVQSFPSVGNASMYFKPSSSNIIQEKVASVFYTTVIPMLNPLIYSLRNKDVKESLKKVLNNGLLSQSA